MIRWLPANGLAGTTPTPKGFLTGQKHSLPFVRRDELVALLPCADRPAAEERAFCLVRDFAEMVGRPCATGAATGRIHALADTFALARRVSRSRPCRAGCGPWRTSSSSSASRSCRRSTSGCAASPSGWLAGPDLVATLDAYSRHDMNRLKRPARCGSTRERSTTASAGSASWRGVHPGSLRGVRVLSAVVARVLAGRWS